MKSLETHTSELTLVSESLTVTLSSIQSSEIPAINTLYIDSYISLYSQEFPSAIIECISGYLHPSEGSSKAGSIDFLRCLSANPVACRAMDETCQFIYFVLCGSHLKAPNYLLLRLRVNELYWYNVSLSDCLKSLTLSRIQRDKEKLSLSAWAESYRNYTQDWIKYSMEQQNQIKKIRDEINTIKSKSNRGEKEIEENTLNYGFGECLLCYDRFKNIVFLPCGHIAACLYCTVKNLKIKLNKKIKKKRLANMCPLCKGVIQEAREVFS